MDFMPFGRDILDPDFLQFLHISAELRERSEFRDGGLGAGHTGALRDLSTYTRIGVKIMSKKSLCYLFNHKVEVVQDSQGEVADLLCGSGVYKGVFQ